MAGTGLIADRADHGVGDVGFGHRACLLWALATCTPTRAGTQSRETRVVATGLQSRCGYRWRIRLISTNELPRSSNARSNIRRDTCLRQSSPQRATTPSPVA